LYNQEYDFGPVTLKVDIMDTAGDLQFPAMRRLSIATAHAFLITYAVDNRSTFELVKGLFEEIREQRADFEEIPIVVSGNKIDVGIINRDIQHDEVCDFIEVYYPNLK
jgi:GTPase SAR1 family protein